MRPVERSKYISGRMPQWWHQCMNENIYGHMTMRCLLWRRRPLCQHTHTHTHTHYHHIKGGGRSLDYVGEKTCGAHEKTRYIGILIAPYLASRDYGDSNPPRSQAFVDALGLGFCTLFILVFLFGVSVGLNLR